MEISPLQYMALANLSYSPDLPTGINPNTNTYYTISELLGGQYVDVKLSLFRTPTLDS